jgi:hypothetical protein
MNEDYLWDRSGPPDIETAQLERILGRLSYHPPKKKTHWRIIAAAAILLVSLAAGILLRRGDVTSWQLRVGNKQATAVRKGQVIETGGTTSAALESQSIGEVHIEPGSKLRLVKAGQNEQQFALDHGTIHAFIWAPPTQFVVDTMAARTVDLGCQYTLAVAPDGSGTLTVTMGWVAFQSGRLESFIPAGAKCRTRPGYGPGTPYREDASKSFIDALNRFDTKGDPAALSIVLQTARPADGLTLWHLLSRTQGSERAEVFDAFRQRIELPQTVTQQGILHGEAQALDAAWDALQLGDTSWWRMWKSRQAPGAR